MISEKALSEEHVSVTAGKGVLGMILSMEHTVVLQSSKLYLYYTDEMFWVAFCSIKQSISVRTVQIKSP